MTTTSSLEAALVRMLALVSEEVRAAVIAEPVTALERFFHPLRVREVELTESLSSDLCSCDGYYDSEIMPGQPWILFRPDVVWERVLFTLLHELGHHLIRHVDDDLLDIVDQIAGRDGDPEQVEEQLCHGFAGQVLVPSELLRSILAERRPTPDDIVRLKNASNASWEAVAVRAASELPGRGAVVLVRDTSSMAFSAPSPALRSPWPRGSAIAPSGALARALSDVTTNEPEVFRWGLDGALALSCDAQPVHRHLAVAVLYDERPSGESLLNRIRGVKVSRPEIDPTLAGEVRTILEDAVSPSIDGMPDEVTVRITKARVHQVLTCERHLLGRLGEAVGTSPDLVRGRLLDRLFAQVVQGFGISNDPVKDALEAAAADRDDSLAEDWATLSLNDQAEVDEIVRAAAGDLSSRWPRLPPNALVRLQETVRAELAGGRVVLSGRVDLMVGKPTATHVGTTMIDVKGGRWRFQDSFDAGWYAVIETLRHGVPPFQTGTYYLRDGALDLVVVSDDLLVQWTSRVADAAERLSQLAAGRNPTTTPNPLCPWCPALPTCQPGRAFVEAGGTSLTGDVYDDETQEDDVDES